MSFAILRERFLIVANGPFKGIEPILKLSEGRIIVALDGAVNHLQQFDFIPHVILGDFDSIQNKAYWGIKDDFKNIQKSYMGNFGILIAPAKDQNYTDLEKGIVFCDIKNASDILIINAFGSNRLDHSLGNLGLLRKYYHLNRPISLLTESQKVEFVKDNIISIKGVIGDYCAIMGYPEAVITTRGLCYDCTNYPLTLGIHESVCNHLAEPVAHVEIKGEALVIQPLDDGRKWI